MGTSISSSLCVLAGSHILGFLALQTSQAQNRFYTDLEDWLATTVRELGVDAGPGSAALPGISGELRTAIERLRETIAESGSGKQTPNAMGNLAEALQGRGHHMRTQPQ